MAQFFKIAGFGLFLIFISISIKQIKPEWIYNLYIWLIGYFITITFASLVVVDKAIEKDPENIARNYFGAMIFRLFVSLIIALLFIYFDRENSIVFAGNFIILYLMFLGFEIYALMANLQAHSEEGKNPYENKDKS